MPLCCRVFDRTNDWEIPAEEIEICKNEKGEDWRLGSGQCTAELLLQQAGSLYLRCAGIHGLVCKGLFSSDCMRALHAPSSEECLVDSTKGSRRKWHGMGQPHRWQPAW